MQSVSFGFSFEPDTILSFPAVHLNPLNLWPRRFQGNLHLDLDRRTQIGRCALQQR
jgi:hypothetical protein